MVLFDRLHEFMWTWSTGLASPRREFQKWIFFAPYQGISILLLMLPSWLGGYVKGDIKLGSTPVTNVRPKLSKRIWWTLLDPHTSVVCSFLGSIGVAIWRATRDYERGTVNVNQTARTFSRLLPARADTRGQSRSCLPSVGPRSSGSTSSSDPSLPCSSLSPRDVH